MIWRDVVQTLKSSHKPCTLQAVHNTCWSTVGRNILHYSVYCLLHLKNPRGWNITHFCCNNFIWLGTDYEDTHKMRPVLRHLSLHDFRLGDTNMGHKQLETWHDILLASLQKCVFQCYCCKWILQPLILWHKVLSLLIKCTCLGTNILMVTTAFLAQMLPWHHRRLYT